MIKVFGKLRYHWQPELSFTMIYWCLSVTPIFISLALLYENTSISTSSFVLFIIFVLLVWIGFQRYFEISEDEDMLFSRGLVPGYAGKTVISTISKIQVSKRAIIIFSDKSPKGKIFYMRKWPKKYFVDSLVKNDYFKGELELIGKTDHYFNTYQDDKKNKLNMF